MQRVWQESAMVSSLVSKRHCRGRSSATGPGGTTERHQQDSANPENIIKYMKIWPNIIWTTTCGTLLLKSFELQPAIQQSGALGIRPLETSRYDVKNCRCVCVCGCARVCPINTALPTVHHGMLRMCQLCKRVPMHWLRQIIGQVFPSCICSLSLSLLMQQLWDKLRCC